MDLESTLMLIILLIKVSGTKIKSKEEHKLAIRIMKELMLFLNKDKWKKYQANGKSGKYKEVSKEVNLKVLWLWRRRDLQYNLNFQWEFKMVMWRWEERWKENKFNIEEISREAMKKHIQWTIQREYDKLKTMNSFSTFSKTKSLLCFIYTQSLLILRLLHVVIQVIFFWFQCSMRRCQLQLTSSTEHRFCKSLSWFNVSFLQFVNFILICCQCSVVSIAR